MMKKKLKVVVLLLAIAGIVLYFRREPGDSAVAPQAPALSGPREEIEQNVTSFSIAGRSPKGVRQWQLDGDSARISGDEIFLDNLRAIAYGEQATVNLTSDSGIYRKGIGEVELTGNVKVISGTEFSLVTESARWSQNTKEIHTEDIVHISREGMTARGSGGSASSEENWARLERDVEVKIEPDTTVISSGPLDVRYDDNVAVFRDNVRVEDKDGRLFADILTVEFDPEDRKISRVVAEGNVKVKKGNSYTLSEKAIYTDTTKSAQLLGRPRIIIDPEELGELDEMWKK